MALKITSADERLATKPKVNIALVAPAGWGKTFQARTLDPDTTLFLDAEAGMLAVGGDPERGEQPWRGDSIKVRDEAAKAGVHPWEFARALVCLLAGPDPSADAASPYGKQWFDIYAQNLAPPEAFDKYTTIFLDSITVASRYAFSWSKMQPQAFSEKNGKPDNRGAYGLLGQEMVTWLTQAQHIPNKSVIVVGILDEGKDEFGRPDFSIQIEGGKTGRELPGIFDQVITGAFFDVTSGQPVMDNVKGTERAFVCHLMNGYGVPAKDRSGRLNLFEAPDLGKLMAKIQSGPRVDTPNFAPPGQQQPPAAEPQPDVNQPPASGWGNGENQQEPEVQNEPVLSG